MMCLGNVVDLVLGENVILRVHYYNGNNKCVKTESFNKWLDRQSFGSAVKNHWYSKVLMIGIDYKVACEVIDNTVLDGCTYDVFMVIHLDCTLVNESNPELLDLREV